MDRQSVDSYVKQNKRTDRAGGKEKRQSERYNVSFKTHIKLSSGEIVTGLAKNISRGGICIEYGTSADIGLEFELMFDVATGNGIEQVLARGKVLRSVAVAGRNVFRIAFLFLALHQDSGDALERFLHKCHQQFPNGY